MYIFVYVQSSKLIGTAVDFLPFNPDNPLPLREAIRHVCTKPPLPTTSLISNAMT
jgi:hypothetical protein